MMAEPVTLYPAKGGEPMICTAPSEVQRLLATGDWALTEPKPEPKPAPKPTPKAGTK